ncbi:hypothetical protein [Cytobacillus sp. NCCP-133]|uniref:hypothetical protein n=1 Tax=Cytobacillus sp. NCCP-133 TaxID=766848 RepID=UPI002230363B|nr:hypothetical protein [Cytobacillus sp. NCCP-133]GLB59013.1 hypothetical protein NCCP133_11460 [Cytobacillus sp. NCCP-133]
MPAEEAELKLASILYYQAFQEKLPVRNYRKQDIEYIIQQLNIKLIEGKEAFESSILH